MLKKLINMINNRELEVDERIFRIMVVLGCTASTMGIIESVMLVDIKGILLPLVIMIAVMVTAFVATFRYHLIHFSSIVLGLWIIIVVFHAMFFFSGGLGGGASVWFSL